MTNTVTGMDRYTGQAISTEAHITQSVADILTTPLGSMPWRRDYGSELYALLDQPLTAAVAALIRAATVTALQKWEPRLRITASSLSATGPEGRAAISLSAIRLDLPTPAPLALTIPV